MDQTRSKAEFRYLRERLGISYELMAEIMECQTRSVRYWEDPNSLRYPPEEAWDVLDDAIEHQNMVVEFTLAKVEEVEAVTGQKPTAVKLPYWLNKATYDELSTDASYGLEGNWQMANANARLIAAKFEERGIHVIWVDHNPSQPQEDEVDG